MTGPVLIIAIVCVALALSAVVAVAADATEHVAESSATSCSVTVDPPEQGTTLLASNGTTVLATIGDTDRHDVALRAIPAAAQRALIDTEDRTFYTNNGVDLHSLARAAVADLSGGSTQGGSTITMQYVKEYEQANATTAAGSAAAVRQDLPRKIGDIRCALTVAKKYSKQQILQAYFNLSYFGQNAYGIDAAAETYFGVPSQDLSVAQAAMLVGLLQNPEGYDPFLHPQAALARRKQVLDAMASAHDLTTATAALLAASPLGLTSANPPATGCSESTVANGAFFCDYVESWLQQELGLSATQLGDAGLTVVTTLDASLQNSGQKAVWRSGLSSTSATALIMPSVDPATGAVQTMITSRHYGVASGETTLPLFTDAFAGSGSTYKYFTAIAALEHGATPDTTLTTGSTSYTTRSCDSAYTVHNDGDDDATLRMADAFAESANTYFVGVEDQLFHCDLTPIVDVATTLGLSALDGPEPGDTSQSIAQAVVAQQQAGFTLGFAPTSALQLAGAYAAAANGGRYCPPHPVTSVHGPTGAALTLALPSSVQAFPRSVADEMVSMMSGDTVRSDGTSYQYFEQWYADGGSVVASKTGTNNDSSAGADGGNGNSALWFAGVTPHLASVAALVDPSHPDQTVSGLPSSVENNGSDVYGAYAATFWQDAYGPRLRSQPWSWPASAAPVPEYSAPQVTDPQYATSPASTPSASTPSPAPSSPRRSR